MKITKAWVWNNCKFVRNADYTPTVEDVNTREPGIKDAEINWEYHGRDGEGEKIYYPDIQITYIAVPGGQYETQYLSAESERELRQRYNQWAQERGWVPVPPVNWGDRMAADDRESYNTWYERGQRQEQDKLEEKHYQTMEDQLQKLNPQPTSKYPDKLR